MTENQTSPDNSIHLILNYRKNRAYAFNVLLGAIETEPQLADIKITFCSRSEELKEALRIAQSSNNKSLVLWSFFSAEFDLITKSLKYFKTLFPSSHIRHLAGGVHASALPEQTLQAGFDLVFRGEGEQVLLDYLLCIKEGRDYHHLKGLAWMEEGIYKTTGLADPIDLSRYPFYSRRYRKMNPIEITRGCIYACKYCQTPYLFKAKFRHRDTASICEDLRRMNTGGKVDIRFITPSAFSYGANDENPNLDKVEELLSSIRQVIGDNGNLYYGSFPSEIRPEHITPQSLSMLKKYINNDNLIIGAQSGSPAILDSSHRGHTQEETLQAVHYCLEAGFKVNVDFIFGLPGETPEDIHKSLEFIFHLAELGARIHNHTFMPLPQTPYRNAPPGVISENTLQALQSLVAKGALYGQWLNQLHIAQKLTK